MTAPDAAIEDPELNEVAWDLTDLLDGAGRRSAGGGRPAARRGARAARRRSRRATPARSPTLDGAGLVAAMHELAEIEETAGRAGTYAHLSFSINTADPAIGALLQRVEEKGTEIETLLLFFHLEWAALDDAKAAELLAADGLDFARHHLETARRYRPHLLTEPEERILTEKALSRPQRLGAAVRGADRGDRGRPRRGRAGGARDRAGAALQPRPRRPPRHRRARHHGARSPGCARARTSSTRCSPTRWSTTGCASTRTGCRRATSPTRRPTSPCRR